MGFFLLIIIIFAVFVYKKKREENQNNLNINQYSSGTVQKTSAQSQPSQNTTPAKSLIEDYDIVTKIEQGSLDIIPELSREDFIQNAKSKPGSVYTWQAWDSMIDDSDSQWCFLSNPVEYATYGRMRFLEMMGSASADIRSKIDEYEKVAAGIADSAKQIALRLSGREFDMSIIYPYVNNGKMERAEVKFDAWRLEHFEKLYRFDDDSTGYYTIDAWDYCLGKDGKLYVISSKYGKYDANRSADKLEYSVWEMIPFNILFMENRIDNVFISIMHGLVFALDMVRMDEIHTSFLERDQSKYTYNFPLQVSSPCYPPGGGITARLNRLLGSGIAPFASMVNPLNNRGNNRMPQPIGQVPSNSDLEYKLAYVSKFVERSRDTALGEIEERKFVGIYKELCDSGKLDSEAVISFIQVCLNNLDYVFKVKGFISADDFNKAVDTLVNGNDFNDKPRLIKTLLDNSGLTMGSVYEWKFLQSISNENSQISDMNWLKISNHVKELAVQFGINT